jgi:hypothetical protein
MAATPAYTANSESANKSVIAKTNSPSASRTRGCTRMITLRTVRRPMVTMNTVKRMAMAPARTILSIHAAVGEAGDDGENDQAEDIIGDGGGEDDFGRAGIEEATRGENLCGNAETGGDHGRDR